MEYKILNQVLRVKSYTNLEKLIYKRTFIRYSKIDDELRMITLALDRLAGQLVLYAHCQSVRQPIVTDLSIKLHTIKEVRLEKIPQAYRPRRNGTKRRNEEPWLTIFYGRDFHLSSVSLGKLSYTEDHCIEMREALLEVVGFYCQMSYGHKLDCWILSSFYEIFDGKSKETHSSMAQITLEQLKAFTMHICYPISSVELQMQFQTKSINGLMGFDGFYATVRSWFFNPEIFNECFRWIPSTEPSPAHSQIFMQRRLLELEHREAPGPVVDNVIEGTPCHHTVNASESEIKLCSDQVMDSLFSKDNSICSSEISTVIQDMTQPLSHYWIASSHNTYLTGNQITSESSVEAYVRCLRLGCRCVELDCWDGKDGNPIIYHGRTRTTKIPFQDVLEAIKEHAFETSKYPVILSVENHCGIKQQKIMAKKFEEIFGSMLTPWAVNDNESCLLSPENLKGKIILKCKKITRTTSFKTETQEPLNVFPIIHSGVMYINNYLSQGHSLAWQPYFFGLNRNHLLFQIPSSQTLQVVDKEGNLSLDRPFSVSSTENLHLNEKWFHGKVGREEAESRLSKTTVDGAFLVREDSGKNGDFELCFINKRKPTHRKIQFREDSTKCFVVLENESDTFHSLFSLICFYQNNPFSFDGTFVKLTAPVPVPVSYERREWFHPEMDWKSAESILVRVKMNGAFLVHYSKSSNVCQLIISFRHANEIKHCRVRETGTSLMVNTKTFSDIVQLVEHYRTHPFYRGTMLEHPIVADLCTMAQSMHLQRVILVEAIKSFTRPAGEDSMLSFKQGDIITSVSKKDENVWVGNLGNQIQKYFPSSYVRIIEMPSFNAPEGSIGLGKVEIRKCSSSGFPYIIEIMNESLTPFRAAVKTEEEAKTWQKMIHRCLKEQDNGDDESKKKSVLSVIRKIFPSNEEAGSSNTKVKVAPELSNLVCFATGSKLSLGAIDHSNTLAPNELLSYNESIAKTIVAVPGKFCRVHANQLCRIYPLGTRFNSSNFNPLFMWNTGCQLVALNYQTPDKWMQVNLGKFRQNASCGYVLKPDYMLNSDTFNPNDLKCLEEFGIRGLRLNLTVIAGRNFTKHGNKPVMDLMVKLEVLGADFDCAIRRTRQRAAWENGFCPYWNQSFSFNIRNPDLALLRIVVQDKDSFNDSYFIGHSTHPVRCLRPGYRSVQILSEYGDETSAILLVKLEISDLADMV